MIRRSNEEAFKIKCMQKLRNSRKPLIRFTCKFHMNWTDLKYVFVWWTAIDLMSCDDSVVNILFIRFDIVKSALSVGLIFL
jgi:hypothetical protein